MKSKFLAVICTVALVLMSSCQTRTLKLTYEDKSDVRNVLISATQQTYQSTFAEKNMTKAGEIEPFSLFVNCETGTFVLENMQTHRIWRSNYEEESVNTDYAVGSYVDGLYSQLHVQTVNPETKTVKLRTSHLCAYKRNGLHVTLQKNGFDIRYEFVKEKITIDVSYRLAEDGLTVDINTDSIVENGEELVYNISVLPMFVSQTQQEDGYFVVPQGSGGIIRFNDSQQTETKPYRYAVYGNDPVSPPEAQTNYSDIQALPIIGAKLQDDGVLMIADKGSASAYVNAALSTQITAYHQAFFDFDIRISQISIIGDPSNWDYQEITTFEKTPIQAGTIAVRYVFLPEQENSLAGMAKAVRTWLFQDRSVSGNSDIAPIYFRVLAAVQKQTSILGFPTTSDIPVTTIENLQNISDELKASQVQGMQFVYDQWNSDTLAGMVLGNTNLIKKLGSIKQLQQLQSNLEACGGQVYLGGNLLTFSKSGNGAYLNNGVILNLNYESVNYPRYRTNVYYPKKGSSFQILNTYAATSVFQQYLSRFDQIKEIGLCLSDIVKIAGGDYSPTGLRRNATVNYYENMLKSAGTDYCLLGDSPNAYALCNLTSVYNLSVQSPQYVSVSESVPFMQMVLQGVMPYGSEAINANANSEDTFLTCLETCMAPTYEIAYDLPESYQGLSLTSYYGADYSAWKKTIISQYHIYKKLFGLVGNAFITNYARPLEGIVQTEYDNGCTVFVNHTDTAITFQGIEIPEKSFTVMKGGVAIG